MALVGVEHLGRRRAGEREYARTARTPPTPSSSSWSRRCSLAAAVQPVGDPAQRQRVVLDVGVEQQQRHPADLGHPDAGVQLARPAGQRERTVRGGAVALAQQRDRQPVGVEDRVVLLLPALARQRLAEVAVPVEQADADERHAEVAGGLEVVAGQDAEAAGVLRQRGGDAELRREVGDRLRRVRARPASGTSARRSGTARGRRGPARACRRNCLSSASSRSRAAGTAPSVLTGSSPLRRHSSGSTAAKRSWVSGCQDQRRLVGQVAQRAQRLGQDRTDGESTDGSHGER